MVVDFGCIRILIYKRYVSDFVFMGDKIIVLMVMGECFLVFIVNVEFVSKEGKYVELVGVLDILFVDCLFGRFFFGKMFLK